MATVYSAEVAIGSWNRIRIKCDYSGTSATLTVQFRRTSAYTDHWYSNVSTLTFNGQQKSAPFSYNGYVPASVDWSNPINLVTVSGYTISTSGGTYSWSFNDASVLSCSGTITIPSQGSAPSNGNISGLQCYYNNSNGYIEFSASSVSVSSSLTLDTAQFRILTVPNTGSGLSSQAVTFTNGGPVVLNQYNSIANNGGVTISPNTLYYAGIYASNSVGGYWYNGPSIVSPCTPATFSIAKASNSSATVTYGTVADGGVYDKLIEYSLDNGANWVTGATVSSSSATTGTFTVSYLDPETTYTMLFRIRTQAGTTDCSSLTFSLLHPKFYGPVSDLTEKANMLYGSLAHLVASSYTLGSQDLITSFDSAYLEKYAWEEIKKKLGFEPEYPLSQVDFTYTGATENIKIEVTFSDNSKYTYYDGILDSYAYILSNKLGCRGLETTLVTPPGVDLTDSVTMVTTLSRNTKLIKKLYASENGRAKLIYKENS